MRLREPAQPQSLTSTLISSCTPNSTVTPTTPCWTARRRPRRCSTGPSRSACRRWRSPTTTGCTARSRSGARRVQRGIRPIIGAEVTLAHGSHLTLLAETQAGYANLSRLISVGQLAGTKGSPRLTIEDVARHAAGLLCLSGCRQGAVAQAILADDEALAGARGRQAGRHLRPRPAAGSSCSATGCPTTTG